jgi:hypothetical protein
MAFDHNGSGEGSSRRKVLELAFYGRLQAVYQSR